MPVDIVYLDKRHGVMFSCHGLLTGKELIDGLKELAKGDLFTTLKYAILDQSAVESFSIANADIHSVVKHHKEFSYSVPKHTVVAVIAPTSLGYGLARMWQSLVADIHWVTKVFKSDTEARDWVKESVKEHHDIQVHITK